MLAVQHDLRALMLAPARVSLAQKSDATVIVRADREFVPQTDVCGFELVCHEPVFCLCSWLPSIHALRSPRPQTPSAYARLGSILVTRRAVRPARGGDRETQHGAVREISWQEFRFKLRCQPQQPST